MAESFVDNKQEEDIKEVSLAQMMCCNAPAPEGDSLKWTLCMMAMF